jgi:hypothetical protein
VNEAREGQRSKVSPLLAVLEIGFKVMSRSRREELLESR